MQVHLMMIHGHVADPKYRSHLAGHMDFQKWWSKLQNRKKLLFILFFSISKTTIITTTQYL